MPFSGDFYVFELARLVVDADLWRRDPTGELSGLDNRLHQPRDEIAVGGGRQPLFLLFFPIRFVEQFAGGARLPVAEFPDKAVESDVRQSELELDAGRLDDLVPARNALAAIVGVIIA